MKAPTTLILTTVAQAVDSLEQYFLNHPLAYGQGTLEAYDEAVYLTLFALDLPPDDLNSYLDVRLTTAQKKRLQSYAEQRVQERKPVAYITQEGWLMGFPFFIDERVIIPRSFIAEIISNSALYPTLPPSPKKILDICTGSACLAIIAAQLYPDAQVTAIDLSPDALAVAHINIENYECADRVQLLQGDMLSPLPADARFDLIICNPPYVNAQSVAAFPPEFQQEPVMAFAAGKDGMDLIRPLLASIHQHLSDQGVLLLEIGQERRYFEAAFPSLKPQWLATELMDDGVLLLTAQQLKKHSLN